MVIQMIRILFIVFCFSLSISCSATEEGTEPKLNPLDIGNIKKITISSTGIKSVADVKSNIVCKNFILTKKEVEEYFNIANKVTNSDYRHIMDWSPCFVEGEIILDDGKKGKWAIHQYRGGTINFGNNTIYMYCPSCSAKLFDNPEYIHEK